MEAPFRNPVLGRHPALLSVTQRTAVETILGAMYLPTGQRICRWRHSKFTVNGGNSTESQGPQPQQPARKSPASACAPPRQGTDGQRASGPAKTTVFGFLTPWAFAGKSGSHRPLTWR